MCFTFIGRIHTRLATLIGPLVLTWFFATFTQKPDYWTLFWLMSGVGLLLDIIVYGWLISYQPRWLTLILATGEFALLKWIMEWPYPFELRLRTRQALELYILAWILIWLTLHVFLPILWPRWTEDGGEFRTESQYQAAESFTSTYTLTQRRRAYILTTFILGLAGLPWLVAKMLTPEEYRFTGLLLMEPTHLRVLQHANSTAAGNIIHLVPAVISWLAHIGRWPVTLIYDIVRGFTAFVWLAGLYFCVNASSYQVLRLIALGGVPLMLFPVTWLAIAALVVWMMALIPWRWHSLKLIERYIIIPLLVIVLCIWCLAWIRTTSAPLLYVHESTWQAMIWLNQSVPSPETIATPSHLRDFVAAFSGQAIVNQGEPAILHLIYGTECEASITLFRHGRCCIIEVAK